MTTLRTSLQDYLAMRRGLGFKLHDAGVGLLNFVSFMERKRAAHITTDLALEWAQKSKSAHPAESARRLSWVRGFARYQSAIDPRTEIPASAGPTLYLYRPRNRGPACSRSNTAPSGQTARLDISLPVWNLKRLRSAHQ